MAANDGRNTFNALMTQFLRTSGERIAGEGRERGSGRDKTMDRNRWPSEAVSRMDAQGIDTLTYL